MPFKSQAQRRKFAQLLVEGKISNETFEEWNRETGGRKLPERVRAKAKSRAKSRSRPRAAKSAKAITSMTRMTGTTAYELQAGYRGIETHPSSPAEGRSGSGDRRTPLVEQWPTRLSCEYPWRSGKC
jgi:hypothetical protein